MHFLRHANHESQIEKQKRRGEEEAVDQIERAADSRQHIAGIFHPRAAFDDRLRKITDDRGETEDKPSTIDGSESEPRNVRHQLKKADASEQRKGKRPEESLPGFLRADVRDQRMPPDHTPGQIRAHVAELVIAMQ